MKQLSERKVRVFAAAAAIPLLCAVSTGCGSSSGGGASTTKTTKVAYVMPSSDEYFIQMSDGAKAYAKAHPDIDLDVQFGASYDDTSSQIAKIQDALAQGPKALAFVPSAKGVFVPALKQAQADDVPVVLVDTPETGITATSFIATNNEKGGAAAGKYVTENLQGGGAVGVLLARPGQLATDARVEGFKSALNGSSAQVVAGVRGDCDAAKGRAAMEDMLTAHPDLKAVFSPCDGSALGAIKAIAAAKKDVMVVSFDASPSGVAEVERGTIAADVAQHPEKMGAEAVRLAAAAGRGEKIPGNLDTGVELVTKDNAAAYQSRSLAQKIQ
jgi:ribose transport system substrate-binding protein